MVPESSFEACGGTIAKLRKTCEEVSKRRKKKQREDKGREGAETEKKEGPERKRKKGGRAEGGEEGMDPGCAHWYGPSVPAQRRAHRSVLP